MVRYAVYSLDMWGHVPADCCASYGCKCVNQLDDGLHNDDACECHEDMNNRHQIGAIEVSDEATDADIVAALIDEGLATEQARTEAQIDDCNGMGDYLGVLDKDGRAIFQLEKEEES